MDKKVKSITIRVDEETREKIVLQANAEHREVSDFIRHAIITYHVCACKASSFPCSMFSRLYHTRYKSTSSNRAVTSP